MKWEVSRQEQKVFLKGVMVSAYLFDELHKGLISRLTTHWFSMYSARTCPNAVTDLGLIGHTLTKSELTITFDDKAVKYDAKIGIRCPVGVSEWARQSAAIKGRRGTAGITK